MFDPTKSSGEPPKDFAMEKRLLLAFILMGLVLFLTPYFYKPPPPPKQATPPAKTTQQAQTQSTTPPKPAEAPSSELPAPSAAAQKEEKFVVDTNLYRVEFSNRGAVVQS